MGTAVGSMYSFLNEATTTDYLILSWTMLGVLILAIWIGRKW